MAMYPAAQPGLSMTMCVVGLLTSSTSAGSTPGPDRTPPDASSNSRSDAGVVPAPKYKTWRPGQTLRIYYTDAVPGRDDELKSYVQSTAPEWTRHANLSFMFFTDEREFRALYRDPKDLAEVRISFAPGRNEAYIGTDALADPTGPTLWLGGLRGHLANNDADLARRLVLHEFGHVLGRRHEHQSPAAMLPWRAYRLPVDTGKTAEEIERNWLAKYEDALMPDGRFDPDSIMMYGIPDEHTMDGFSAATPTRLSSLDQQRARMMYPDPGSLPDKELPAPVGGDEPWKPRTSAKDAVSVGLFDHRTSLICRADGSRGPVVGQTDLDSESRCMIGVAGKLEFAAEYSLLVVGGHAWSIGMGSLVPADALRATVQGAEAVPCRVVHGDNDILGSLQHGHCVVTEIGGVTRWPSYELLRPAHVEAEWEPADRKSREQQGWPCRAFDRGSTLLGWVTKAGCRVAHRERALEAYQVYRSQPNDGWLWASVRDASPVADVRPVGVHNSATTRMCRVLQGGEHFGQLEADRRCYYTDQSGGLKYASVMYEVLVPRDAALSASYGTAVDPRHWKIDTNAPEKAPCLGLMAAGLRAGWIKKGACTFLSEPGSRRETHLFYVLGTDVEHSWRAPAGEPEGWTQAYAGPATEVRVICRDRREGFVGWIEDGTCIYPSRSTWSSTSDYEILAFKVPSDEAATDRLAVNASTGVADGS